MLARCDTHSVPRDLQRGHVLEFGRRQRVRQRAHVLRREPVGAHERHLLELLQAGGVDHDAVRSPPQRAAAQAALGQLHRLAQEVRLEQDAVEGDPEPGERLALAGDHPGARLVPELEGLAVAIQHALDQLVGGVVLDLAPRAPANPRPGRARSPRRPPRRRRTRRSSRRRNDRSCDPVGPAIAVASASEPPLPSPRPSLGPCRRSGCAARPGRRPARARLRARCRWRGCADGRRAAPSSRSRPRTARRCAGLARDRTAAPPSLPPASSAAPVLSIQRSATRSRTVPASQTTPPTQCSRSICFKAASESASLCQLGERGTRCRS